VIADRLRARLSRAASDDAGVSLVEVLVTMMVSAVLLAIAGSLFVSVAQATTASNQTRDAAAVAGNGANAIGRAVRSAVQLAKLNQVALEPAIIAGSDSSLTLSSLVMESSSTSLEPVQIRYSVVGGALIEETWTGSSTTGYWLFPSAATSTKNLGSTIVPAATGETPLFSYLDAAGAPIVAAAGGLTPAQRLAVTSVRLVLRVQSASSATSAPVIIDTVIGMPNLGYSGDDS